MYGKRKSAMVLELNASDARGIEVVRDQIKSFVSSKGLFAGKQAKLVILDEADNMTKAAQFAMRRYFFIFSKNNLFERTIFFLNSSTFMQNCLHFCVKKIVLILILYYFTI